MHCMAYEEPAEASAAVPTVLLFTGETSMISVEWEGENCSESACCGAEGSKLVTINE